MKKAFELGFSQTTEEISLDRLPVQGVIPEWLSGSLLRNGPGTFQVGDENYRHWFDGLAMLHRFSFQKGNISYANKFLRCRAYDAAQKSGKISYSEFATDPCFSIFERVKVVFSPKMTDSAKVNIAKIGDMYLALGETPMQIEFDPDTLDSLGVFNYDGRVTQHVTTVHPHFDGKQDKTFQITTRFGRISQYRILQVAGSRRPEVIASRRVKEPAYMHSFGMSPNYFILTEFPLVVYPLNILLTGKPFIENFRWKPDKGTPFYVFDRKTGELVAELESDPFFGFHHVNSFEFQGKLYVDIVAYPDAGIIDAFYLDRIHSEKETLPGGEFRRYTIDFQQSKTLDYETFSEESIELPRYDYSKYNMDGNYQYVYGISISRENPLSFYNQMVKIDLKSRESMIWFEEGCYPGEPVFVNKPSGIKEDDGVILSVVLNEKKGNSFLLILDAQTFTEIGRAEIPHPVLFGYHGEYFNRE